MNYELGLAQMKYRLRDTQSSNIAILLISADFFASSIIVQHELPYIITAEKQKQLIVLCVIVRPCAFTFSELTAFQSMSNPNRPLSTLSYAERETAWVKIINQIEQVQVYGADHSTGTLFQQETIG